MRGAGAASRDKQTAVGKGRTNSDVEFCSVDLDVLQRNKARVLNRSTPEVHYSQATRIQSHDHENQLFPIMSTQKNE